MDIKRTFTQWPFRRKLLLLLLIIFLPALGIIVASGLSHRQEEIVRARNNALLLTQSLAAQQEQIANSTKTMLSVLAQLRMVQNLDAQACNELFRELPLRYPLYAVISAITADGHIFASSDPLQSGLNVSDRKHIQDAIRTLDFSVGEYIVAKITKVNSLHFSFPVLDAQKKLIAILTASIDLNKFGRFISTVNLPEGSAVVFTDHKGIRLFRFPENQATPIGKPAFRGFFDAISGEVDEGLFEWKALDGVIRINAFKQLRLKKNSAPYLYIIVGLSKERILHAANLKMLGNLAILGLVALLAMSMAWVFGNLVLIQPINRLVAATRRFGMGEMDIRTGLPHTLDELGRLAQAFDDMASLLEMRNIERRQTEEDLKESEGRLRHLTSQLLTAQEAERTRLALELHDDLGQSLTVLKMQIRVVDKELPPNLAESKERLRESLNYINRIIENVRRISRNLRPSIVEDLGLSTALQSLLEEFTKYQRLKISVAMDDLEDLFPVESQVVIYRVFQECLNNISKHSHATNCKVTVKKHDSHVTINIEDNGEGFDMEKVWGGRAKDKGLGLAAMEERVRLIGGALHLWSQPGQGTKVVFNVPIPKR